jgi:hypothetical protein
MALVEKHVGQLPAQFQILGVHTAKNQLTWQSTTAIRADRLLEGGWLGLGDLPMIFSMRNDTCCAVNTICRSYAGWSVSVLTCTDQF